MAAVEIFPDSDSLARAAAERLVQHSAEAIDARGQFTIALSGGSTPKAVYAHLASDEFKGRVDWSRVQVFWGDERCVSPDDPQSNYRMAREALLDHVPIPSGNIHRMHGEDEPHMAAAAYAKELQEVFGGDPESGGPPPVGFDLILLGMGDDGHTASLFPGHAAVMEQRRWVMAEYVEGYKTWRITLTPVIINAAESVAFIVSGEGKAARLRDVLEGQTQPLMLPAQAIRPTRGRLSWLLDEGAASSLKKAT
jgi:6-phosphogluconolactonase